MEQAKDEFVARGLSVRTANSRDELMSDIRSTNLTENAEGKAEIMVVNIQKFKQDSAKIQIDSNYSTVYSVYSLLTKPIEVTIHREVSWQTY